MRFHLTAIVLALSACGDGPAETTAERQSAAGEVLGGEISDEMLPLDSVRSTAPAKQAAPTQTGGATPDGPAENAVDRQARAPDAVPTESDGEGQSDTAESDDEPQG